MTSAQALLNRGLVKLAEQLPETFTLPSHPGFTFLGLIDRTTWSNELGAGGFIPESRGDLTVPKGEFDKIGLTPWPGLKLVVMDRHFVVTSVGKAFNLWNLSLEQSHPKPSDLPHTAKVIATDELAAIVMEAGQIEVKP